MSEAARHHTLDPEHLDRYLDAYLAEGSADDTLGANELRVALRDALKRGVRETDLAVGAAIALVRVRRMMERSGFDAEMRRNGRPDTRERIETCIALQIDDVAVYLVQAFGGTLTERLWAHALYTFRQLPARPRTHREYTVALSAYINTCDLSARPAVAPANTAPPEPLDEDSNRFDVH